MAIPINIIILSFIIKLDQLAHILFLQSLIIRLKIKFFQIWKHMNNKFACKQIYQKQENKNLVILKTKSLFGFASIKVFLFRAFT